MELDEMKNVWTEMSLQIEKQKKLTDKLIISMTQEKYHNRLNRIKTPELISTAISFTMAIVILINFDKYTTAYLVTCAVISIGLLSLLPILSIKTIYGMSDLNISNSNYKQILIDYAKSRNKLLSVQKLSFYLGFVLLITTLPVMVKVMGGKDVPIESKVWYWFIPCGFLFYAFFARWVYGYYVKTTVKIEGLLKEIEE